MKNVFKAYQDSLKKAKLEKQQAEEAKKTEM